MQLRKEKLGTPPIDLCVRRCSRCNKYCYFYDGYCYLCAVDKLR